MPATRATTVTLTPNVASTVTFPLYFATITIDNLDTNGIVWVRTDGQLPEVAGNDCYDVLPMQSKSFPNGNLQQEPVTRVISGTQVNLISSTAVTVVVYGT